MWTRSRSCPEAGRSTGAATGARDWVLALPVPYSDRANPSAEMRPAPFWWDNFPRDLLMANNLKQRTKYCHPSAVSALIRRDNFTQHNLVSYFYRSLATLTLYWIMRSHCGLRLLKSGSYRTIRRWSDKWSLLNGQPLVISCSYIWFCFYLSKIQIIPAFDNFCGLKEGIVILAWESVKFNWKWWCTGVCKRDQQRSAALMVRS